MSRKFFIGVGVTVIIIILAVLLGKYAGYDIGYEKAIRDISQGEKNKKAQDISENNIYPSCGSWRSKPFQKYPEVEERYLGSLSLEGTIKEKSEPAFWEENKTVLAVYFEIAPQNQEPGKNFYNGYRELVEYGNSINSLDGDTLFFRLGILESGKLVSTAKLSDQTNKRIIDSIDKRTPLRLNLVLPPSAGVGAPSEFSFACEINAE